MGEGNAPAEMGWIVVMDRVGGYAGYAALLADAAALDDVLIAMAGEAEAHHIQRMKAEVGHGR